MNYKIEWNDENLFQSTELVQQKEMLNELLTIPHQMFLFSKKDRSKMTELCDNYRIKEWTIVWKI